MVKLTHEEADRRVKAAMAPPSRKNGAGQAFAPGIQKVRETAKRRSPAPAGRQITTAR